MSSTLRMRRLQRGSNGIGVMGWKIGLLRLMGEWGRGRWVGMMLRSLRWRDGIRRMLRMSMPWRSLRSIGRISCVERSKHLSQACIWTWAWPRWIDALMFCWSSMEVLLHRTTYAFLLFADVSAANASATCMSYRLLQLPCQCILYDILGTRVLKSWSRCVSKCIA